MFGKSIKVTPKGLKEALEMNIVIFLLYLFFSLTGQIGQEGKLTVVNLGFDGQPHIRLTERVVEIHPETPQTEGLYLADGTPLEGLVVMFDADGGYRGGYFVPPVSPEASPEP